jgi:lipid-binding SYLF domain-containing protein
MFLMDLSAWADTAAERLDESATVLSEVMEAPDQGIPQDLLEDAHCVVIVPSVKKAAFIIGGKYGRGFAVCRNERNTGWGAPAAIRIEGGSIGWQVGGSETDVIMLVMNKSGMESLMESKFTLGGAAEVAAGPVGRKSTAETDAKMSAKILSYSRSRGIFAGVSLGGATLRNDLDSNKELYGKRLNNREILMQKVKAPAAASKLLMLLSRYSKHEA